MQVRWAWNPVEFTPKHTAALMLQYQIPLCTVSWEKNKLPSGPRLLIPNQLPCLRHLPGSFHACPVFKSPFLTGRIALPQPIYHLLILHHLANSSFQWLTKWLLMWKENNSSWGRVVRMLLLGAMLPHPLPMFFSGKINSFRGTSDHSTSFFSVSPATCACI